MDVAEQLAKLVDEIIDIGDEVYTRSEACEKAGVDLEFGRRFWRAAGFPEVGDEVRMFTDADVSMLRGVTNLLESEVAELKDTLEIARVIGQTSSRLAAAEISVLRERVSRPPVTAGGMDPQGTAETVEMARSALPFLEDALVYLWKRHLSASAKRVLLTGASGDQPIRCVGFIDMAGFARQSRTMGADELQRLINKFESIAFDVVSSLGGRVVKLIGDEVMYVTDDPVAGAQIALSLVEMLEEDPEVPRVRGGLSHGPIVEIQGDVFGTTVNVASRLTNVAKPGTIIVSESLKEVLEDAEHLRVRRVRSITTLKGVGRVKAYALRSSEDERSGD